MKLLRCPLNGERPVSEFVYGGEWRPMPDPDAASDAEWAAYVFNRRSLPGVKREWWYHAPSGTWFVAERDVVRDRVLHTWLPADVPSDVPSDGPAVRPTDAPANETSDGSAGGPAAGGGAP